MRIISGKYKGRMFNAKLPTGIRPTQDAVRETIFNILNNYIDFEDIVAADICAGAGMLGIEAISRGAKNVYFVDKSRKSLEYIRNSFALLAISEENAHIFNLDAIQFLRHLSNLELPPLQLIFIDPPYNTSVAQDFLLAIDSIENTHILKEDAILVIETELHTILPLTSNFKLITERQFGATKITFLNFNQ